MAFRYNELDAEIPGGKFRNGKYSFPLEDRDQYASKLQFQIVTINPPTFSSKFSTKETLDRFSDGKGDIKDFRGGDPATLSLGAKCDLYMPQALQFTDTFSYATPDLGAAGAVGLAAAQQGQGLVGAAADAVGQGLKGISDFLGVISGGDVTRLGAVRAANLIPGETASNVVQLAAQATMNPNTRALFSKVNLRRFTFQFKFIPLTAEESRMVQTIVKFFRYHAYPTEIPINSAISLGYEFPDLFRIKAFTKVNGRYIQNGTHIKDCYLESISTTYNPTQATFHRDGTPTEVDLSLNFLEHKTLSRKDIEDPADGNDGVNVQTTTRDGSITSSASTGDLQ